MCLDHRNLPAFHLFLVNADQQSIVSGEKLRHKPKILYMNSAIVPCAGCSANESAPDIFYPYSNQIYRLLILFLCYLKDRQGSTQRNQAMGPQNFDVNTRIWWDGSEVSFIRWTEKALVFSWGNVTETAVHMRAVQ